jgi:HEAT repeat protein
VDEPAPDEIERLLLDLKDDRRDVRSRAAYELGKHADPRAVMPLIAALSDSDKFVRSWAVGALGKAGTPAVGPLRAVLAAADRDAAYQAALALAALGDVRAVPTLAAAVRGGDWDIRSAAASALAELGDTNSLPDRILADDSLDTTERLALLRSLHGVAHSDDEVQILYILPDLAELCRDRSRSEEIAVRHGAVETLQVLEGAERAAAGAAQQVDGEPAPAVGDGPAAVQAQDAAAAPRTDAEGDAEAPKRSIWDKLTGR